MSRRVVSTVLSGALALSSFLCLGMGMDMGSAWAPQESHDCCPGGKAPADQPEANCCLLLPGAVQAPVALTPPLFVAVLRTALAADARPALARSVPVVLGPPGAASPGYAFLAAPRAPPAA